MSRATAFWLALALYLGLAGACVLLFVPHTGGEFVYPLDDTYISMSMAKNLARHGVMGLTRFEFSSSSSCPLWIVLLAGMYLTTGVTWWAPLLLGLVAGGAALAVAWRVLGEYGADAPLTAATLAAICLLAPLPALGLSGMEHTLHIALFLAFGAIACRYLAEGSVFARADLVRLSVLMPVMVMVRYESLFAAAVFSLLAVCRRRWLAAVAVPAAGALAAVAFGAFSVALGWSWLPNTLLIKGSAPDFTSARGIAMFLGIRSFAALRLTPHLFALVCAMGAVWLVRARQGAGHFERARLMLPFGVLATLLHLQFAAVGWFFRYEAYLVAFGLLALTVNRADRLVAEALDRAAWRKAPLRAVAVAAAVVLVARPLAVRAGEAVVSLPVAAGNVFDQQYQMARFVQRYCPNGNIAANDVGAINFFNDLRCLDLAGLCHRDVFRLMRAGRLDSAAVDRLARENGVRVAMVYRTWFDGVAGARLPESWRLVAEWTVADSRFLGGDTVCFYALDPGEAERLAEAVRGFAPQLPRSVRMRTEPKQSVRR